MEGFNTIEEALADIRAGKIVLVTDDADRENEGDFICSAEAANCAFMSLPSAVMRVVVVSHKPAFRPAWPVWAERPLGTSTETTRQPEAFTHSIQMSKGARTSP